MPDYKLGRLRGGYRVYWWEGEKRQRRSLRTSDPQAAQRTLADFAAIEARNAKRRYTVGELWEMYRKSLGDRPSAKTMVGGVDSADPLLRDRSAPTPREGSGTTIQNGLLRRPNVRGGTEAVLRIGLGGALLVVWLLCPVFKFLFQKVPKFRRVKRLHSRNALINLFGANHLTCVLIDAGAGNFVNRPLTSIHVCHWKAGQPDKQDHS